MNKKDNQKWIWIILIIIIIFGVGKQFGLFAIGGPTSVVSATTGSETIYTNESVRIIPQWEGKDSVGNCGTDSSNCYAAIRWRIDDEIMERDKYDGWSQSQYCESNGLRVCPNEGGGNPHCYLCTGCGGNMGVQNTLVPGPFTVGQHHLQVAFNYYYAQDGLNSCSPAWDVDLFSPSPDANYAMDIYFTVLGNECSVNSDCDYGEKCDAGVCIPECLTDLDCSGGKICSNQQCVLNQTTYDCSNPDGMIGDISSVTCTDGSSGHIECTSSGWNSDCITDDNPDNTNVIDTIKTLFSGNNLYIILGLVAITGFFYYKKNKGRK